MLNKHNKIWETHLFTYINAEHHDIKKGALDFIYMLLDMGSKSDTAPNTKYKLYETDFRLFDRNESEEIQSIRKFCRDSVLDAVEKAERRIKREKKEGKTVPNNRTPFQKS